MRKRFDIALTFTLLLLGLVSCNVDMPCSESTDVFLRAQLCRIDSLGKERNLTATVTLQANGNDSVWYSNSQLSLLELPLNPNDTETSFEIDLMTEDSVWHHDVLTLSHENRSHFLSMVCGAYTAFRLTGYRLDLSDAIKDVAILQESVDNQTATHLKLYVD